MIGTFTDKYSCTKRGRGAWEKWKWGEVLRLEGVGKVALSIENSQLKTVTFTVDRLSERTRKRKRVW